MTSIRSEKDGFQQSRFGTCAAIGWAGENPADGRAMAFLMAYSLGDGEAGPEGTEEAARALLAEAGLPVGGAAEAVEARPGGVGLVLEAGQAVLTVPHLSVSYTAPPEWVAAAGERGQVYFLFATRPWPQGVPGQPVTEDQLRAFVADEAMLASAAHCLLPVRTVRR